MAKKPSKKNKNQEPGADSYPVEKKRGLLIYVPAFCSLIGTIMLLAVIAAAIPLTIPEFMGYDIYNVVSGSMEPAIPIGSIIYVKEVDPVDIEKGDIIAFQSGETVVMHRVMKNDVTNGAFTTKGDANNAEDLTEVRYSALVGKVARHIPVLGQLLILFGSMLGRICMICFAACGALLNVLASRFREYLDYEEKDERRKEKFLAKAMKASQEPQLTEEEKEAQRKREAEQERKAEIAQQEIQTQLAEQALWEEQTMKPDQADQSVSDGVSK